MNTRDHQLLLDFLSNLSLQDLAARHNMQLHDVVAWADRSDIKQALADIVRISNLRTEAIAATSAPQVLTTLTALADPTPQPTPIRLFRDSTRKACAAILRHTPKSRAPSKGAPKQPQSLTHPPNPAAQPTAPSLTQTQLQSTDHHTHPPAETKPKSTHNSPPQTPIPTQIPFPLTLSPVHPLTSPLLQPLSPSAPLRPTSAPSAYSPSPRPSPARLKAAAGGLPP